MITDPKFKVSASVLDKKGVMKRYAISQIKSAKRTVAAGDPELQELNEKHAVIQDWGGRCRIATFSFDPESQRRKMSMQSFEDIRNAYKNRFVMVKTGNGVNPVPLGTWWLAHPGRRQYREIVFDPTNQCSDDMLNLWDGFAVEPRPGRWDRMRDHIHTVLATGDEASSNYILRWTAWTLQHPDKCAEVALVLMGGKGTGKGTFGNALCQVFGKHALQIASSQLLVGRFNAHLRDICFFFADEAYWPGDKSAEGTLKSLITEPYITVEAKGVDAVPTKNRLHILMASNDDWVVPGMSSIFCMRCFA